MRVQSRHENLDSFIVIADGALVERTLNADAEELVALEAEHR